MGFLRVIWISLKLDLSSGGADLCRCMLPYKHVHICRRGSLQHIAAKSSHVRGLTLFLLMSQLMSQLPCRCGAFHDAVALGDSVFLLDASEGAPSDL